ECVRGTAGDRRPAWGLASAGLPRLRRARSACFGAWRVGTEGAGSAPRPAAPVAPPAEAPPAGTARATPPAPVEDPIKAAEALARRAPDDPARLRAVAEAYVGADRAREALPWQERLVALTDSDADWRRLIELYEWTAQPKLALGALERFAARRPDDRQVVEQLVESLVANERVTDAIPWQRRLVERAPADVPAALRLAQLHEWAGQEKEAIGVYERLDKANRLPAAMLARLGDLYRFQDRPADFLRVAERRLAATPDDEALRLLAVEAAEGLDRPAQAAALLRPLVDARPRDLTVVARYVGLAIRGNRIDDALAVHRRVAATAGVDYRMTVARAFGDAGRAAEAATEYEAVLGLAAGDTRVLREVGRRTLELSRNDVSLKAWRGLLARAPDDPEGLKRSGQILAWNNDNRAAQAAFERFNRVRGGDYEVHFLLGELYTFMRDEARAREQYERALRLLPRRSQLR
ncbi:MAG TPA: hypothetical protein VEA38_20225, partial [Terriglobales bacterium]|nr:hypothetical protein [Terriglobales bacterium]